jgi:hypothetical protein
MILNRKRSVVVDKRGLVYSIVLKIRTLPPQQNSSKPYSSIFYASRELSNKTPGFL